VPSVNLQINAPQGPLITVLIGVSGPREDALKKAGMPVPAPIPANLLVDTGASHTCLDPSIIDPLGLTPSGAVGVHTPSTQGSPVMMEQFDVKLIVPHQTLSRVFPAVAVSKCGLKGQGIDGLLGRDILAHCLLVYNGEVGFYTLAF
jgi:hypothetical protein